MFSCSTKGLSYSLLKSENYLKQKQQEVTEAVIIRGDSAWKKKKRKEDWPVKTEELSPAWDAFSLRLCPEERSAVNTVWKVVMTSHRL